MIVCVHCKNEKPLEEMCKGGARPKWCKDCYNAYMRDYRVRNLKRVRELEKARYTNNPEKRKEQQRTQYHGNKEKHAITARKRKYGLTQEEFEIMQLGQDMKCAICETELVLGVKNGCNIDHDHKTGEVRGLLCRICNTALGFFNDDPDLLMSAALYLERAKMMQEEGSNA